MNKSIEKNPFEEKVRAMAEGFRAFPFPSTQLVFRGETMLPAQAAHRLQGVLDLFQSVRDADGKHRASVDARDKAIADCEAFYEQAVVVVKSHFGSDAKRLASFGLGPVKRHRPAEHRPGETVLERRTEEVIASRDGTVKVVETDEVIDDRQPNRREEPKHPRVGPGTVQVDVPPAPASVPTPTTPAPSPAAAVPTPKPRKPVLSGAQSRGRHPRSKRAPRAGSRGLARAKPRER